MAGELYLQQYELGKEITAGTEVVSTRLGYFEPDSKITRERAGRTHKFASGSRQNTRAFTLGPQMIGGSIKQPLSSSEIIELLLMGVASGVTPSAVGASFLWAFTPGAALQSATMRWMDGARPWRAAGMYIDKLKISGNVREGIEVSADLKGLTMIQQALTGGLTARVPDFIEGWETKLFIDSFGGTAGATNVAGTMINWDIEINNNLTPKQHADNVNSADALVAGEIEVKAKILFEAAQAVALTEFNNWDAATKRLVRIDMGNNTVIETTHKTFVTVDIPGAWEAVDLGGSDENTRAYELSLTYVYDTTNTYGLQIRAQNNRAAAW